MRKKEQNENPQIVHQGELDWMDFTQRLKKFNSHPESSFTNKSDDNELQHVCQSSVNGIHDQAKEGTKIVVQLNNSNNTHLGTSVNILQPSQHRQASHFTCRLLYMNFVKM